MDMSGQRLAGRGRGGRDGLRLSWVDDDTIQVSEGACIFRNGGLFELAAATNVTFAALDTGSRTVGKDYAVFATPDGIKLTLISTYHANGLVPNGYTAQNSRLLGYFHNGPKADGTVGAGRNQAIFPYSVTSNDLLNLNYPYRAHPDLPAGVPLPGMVKVGPLAIGIYLASREDATASAAGTSNYPTSRYGVVPWCSIKGFEANAIAAAVGCRLPTLFEWWQAAMMNPGQATVALQNGNSYYGSSIDDSYLAKPGALTSALAGTGAGNLSAGLYKYRVTFINANGETQGGTESAGTTVTDPGTNGKIALSNIPIGGSGTTARKIYRTEANGSIYKLLTTLNDNVTTTYEDNIADATLGATCPEFNSTGAQHGESDPTHGSGRTLPGTGPRTTEFVNAAGRSWYAPCGIADVVGNVWKLLATFFGGLKTSSPGTGVAWGYQGDYAYNFQGQAYNPDTSGWTEGLPAMLRVGGYWGDGATAGTRIASVDSTPGNWGPWTGFFLAR